MKSKQRISDENVLYCFCPSCHALRRRENNKYTIVKRGRERNGLARFFCLNCSTWFNEQTGEVMKWLER